MVPLKKATTCLTKFESVLKREWQLIEMRELVRLVHKMFKNNNNGMLLKIRKSLSTPPPSPTTSAWWRGQIINRRTILWQMDMKLIGGAEWLALVNYFSRCPPFNRTAIMDFNSFLISLKLGENAFGCAAFSFLPSTADLVHLPNPTESEEQDSSVWACLGRGLKTPNSLWLPPHKKNKNKIQ